MQLEKGGIEVSKISEVGKEKGISRIEEAMNVSIAWVEGKLRLIQCITTLITYYNPLCSNPYPHDLVYYKYWVSSQGWLR